ncbi:MAG: hypothetical protein U5O39_17115 [Gammaproteobacteria bacterium]|nr:hypothetical protein [Gammaproteobacteria bacterium]
MTLPNQVRIVEVGARDGLQNQPNPVPTDVKIELIERLANAGLRHIEAGAFVSPKWVPLMADSAEVMSRIRRKSGVVYSVLTPNRRGMEAAIDAGRHDSTAGFLAATESFSQQQQELFDRSRSSGPAPIVAMAAAQNIFRFAATSPA